ncbi:hypothetical protein HDV00_007772 [Rhizophlyctis rosea]|nr:hypothetical protein HDV00_007772 [Rhizophlyctis rosea]
MTAILQNTFTPQAGTSFLPASSYYTTSYIPCPYTLPNNTCLCSNSTSTAPTLTGTLPIPNDPTQCAKVHYLSIRWPQEGTCIVALLLIGAALYMLQDFIKEYAFSLVDRQNHVQQLTKMNAELRSQLKA